MEKETQSQVDTGVQEVFRRVFDREGLVINRQMTAADVDGWDSLANIQMIVAIEKKFRVKFTTTEILQLKNVGDLLDLVTVRLSK